MHLHCIVLVVSHTLHVMRAEIVLRCSSVGGSRGQLRQHLALVCRHTALQGLREGGMGDASGEGDVTGVGGGDLLYHQARVGFIHPITVLIHDGVVGDSGLETVALLTSYLERDGTLLSRASVPPISP